MNADRRIALGLAALAIATYGWFFGGAGWNQNAQFDLTRALVERRTLYIDAYAANTADVSVGRDGHTYINKPPGVSVLAAIPYALVFGVEQLTRKRVDDLVRVNVWIVTALTCGVSGALIGLALFLFGRKMGVSRVSALIVALSILFGTIVFAYSTMLFAHVPSALFMLLALIWMRDRPLLAGIAAGAAACCFYVCAIASAILLLVFISVSRRGVVRFIAGALPFAILIALYQYVCFGSPWTTSLQVSRRFTAPGLFLGVFRAPTLEALWGLTFSAYRGLFYAAPVLLLAFLGMVIMARRRERVAELIAICAISAVTILVISSFNGWNGGWAFGPRYLLSIIPLLGVPMMFAADVLRPIWILLAALSVSINLIATAVGPMPPDTLKDPIRLWYLPLFSTGRLPPEPLRILQWEDRKMGKVAVQPEAGNLGEGIFGEKSRSSITPVIVWLVTGTTLLFRRATSDDQRNR
jgi:hypothetical protein